MFSENCDVYEIKYGRARQATDGIILRRIFLRAEQLRLQTYICDTYCFSTASIFTRARQNVMFVRTLPVLFEL